MLQRNKILKLIRKNLTSTPDNGWRRSRELLPDDPNTSADEHVGDESKMEEVD
ncbi:hypothetical protein HPP92_012501 [Vanilla planifolia]|uniref:Uncharacterized protein n=1 Tax=Vanilla planifolia TaxID=51239 RepID=A0A835R024_VANPL|nr:hypothetical protein HPP92_012501 [Vanilla planifolia]